MYLEIMKVGFLATPEETGIRETGREGRAGGRKPFMTDRQTREGCRHTRKNRTSVGVRYSINSKNPIL